jgi:PTS system ascorbate-specific IIA component
MDGVGVADRPAVYARTAVTATDWAHAIRAACDPLVRAGCATPRYADRCVEMVREHGPYIVLAPGVALAHARPEDGAVRLALSAVTLARPVAFGHPTNDPVDVVLAFASPDARAHMGLLAALARRLAGGLLETLRAASSDAVATARLKEVVDDVDEQPVR